MKRSTQAQIAGDLDAIEAIVARHPEGLARARLETLLAEERGAPVQWRTLLRRLSRLEQEDRIHPLGGGKRTVYRAGPAVAPEPSPEEGLFPLSPEASRVRALVRRPIMNRKPVGYRTTFLEAYQPGRTWYLPRPLRQRLHEMGRTPDAERPAGTYAREIFGRLLVDLAWASSRLEGNTYTRLDTQNLLEFGQRAQGKDAAETQMILNHKAAIELLVDRADRIGFDVFTFQNLHAALVENLMPDPADEGRLRTRVVDIAGTSFRPLAIPQKVEECFRLMLDKAGAIPDPFEQAFFMMVHIPYLQPFADGNKRTSRLGANLPLIKANLSPLSFIDVPESAYVDATLGVYELNRVELLRDLFAWAYERSCAQYRVMRDQMPRPDPLRLRYRAELADVVRETVAGGTAPRGELLRSWAVAHGVAELDADAFAETALTILLGLHDGALFRYGLRPTEFMDWRSRFSPA
jgi:fido (protein-threonine AMPylation protein)